MAEDINNILSGIKRSLKEDKEEKWYDYLFAILLNLILLYIANNLIYWNLSFIAASFSNVLWAVNLSLIVAVVANVSFILYDPRWFKICSKIIMNITALVAAFTLLTVFPFVINQFILVLGLKIILIIGILASVVSILFQIMKLAYLMASY
ncbi:hypothetical protein Metbo_1380 [Methanobacterium lacus]|uniref:Uncharacterized protein n=1 Tax=Methanobacterium lacus (strain AL-21) TaxID=877455 RepID=F0T7Z4_METLA|nr:hypothetical protein [Methanobacterium lacus]ADZ09620.1 hypothetical protein Metbo_1380 [Methanobacterium lacus]